MSKVLVIPDVHMKKEVIERGLALARKHRADKIVMLGDYFDDWCTLPYEYLEMIRYLKKLLRGNPTIIPLLGNHELSYMGFPCSGYCRIVADQIQRALMPDHRFLFGVCIDGVFYSHAGVTTAWLKNNGLITQNDLRLKLNKKTGAELLEKCVSRVETFDVFAQAGPARGGRQNPSLVWADLTELIADPVPVKQVVGHTPLHQIENIGKVWFTDVYSNNNLSDEYLLVKDGEPEIIHYSVEDSKYGK